MSERTDEHGMTTACGPYDDGMNEHDQLRQVVIENANLKAEIERLQRLLNHAVTCEWHASCATCVETVAAIRLR